MRGLDSAWRQLRWPLAVGSICVLLFIVRAFEPLELMTHDARFLLRGYTLYRLASSDVVIVGITQQCIDRLGKLPWSRRVYAQAIERLAEAETSIICLDLFFPTEGDPEEDRALVKATRQAGNVIFPVFCPMALRQYAAAGPMWHVDVLRSNFPELNAAAAGLGHINIPPSLDGKCRMTPVALEHQGYAYLSLGIEAASRFLERGIGAADGKRRDRTGFLRHVPSTPEGGLLVNYYGQHVTFDFVPFHRIIEGTFPMDMVKGKLVLVGQTALGHINADLITTPLGEMYGVFVQGTIVDNMLTGNFLSRQGLVAAVVTIFVVAVLGGLILLRLSSGHGFLAWVGTTVLLFLLAVHLFESHGYVLELVPCIAVLAGNFGVCLAVNFRRSHEMVRHQESELSSILRSSRFSAEDFDSEKAPQALMSLFAETLGARLVSLTLADQPDSLRWLDESWNADEAGRQRFVDGVASFEKLTNASLLEKDQAVFTNRMADMFAFPEEPPPAGPFLSTPLTVRSKTIGLLNLYDKRPTAVSPGETFSQDDLRLVVVLAQQTALVLNNTKLIEDLGNKNAQLRLAMRELKTAQDELIYKGKLSAVGEMASMIIHDMRGPLTAAFGYVGLVQDLKAGDDAELKDYASRILKELYRMNQMAQEVLDFSRGTKKLALEMVQVGALIEELLQRLRGELTTESITLRSSTNYEGLLRVDREKMLRVFLNLGRNAAEAMQGRGVITIECGEDGKAVRFTVSDNGPGIPEQIKDKLFRPFVSSGKAKGTGLGLAIVKKIVEDHGGFIRAESAPDRGTSFHIYLPLPGASTVTVARQVHVQPGQG